MHVAIKSTSFSLIGLKLEFLWLFVWNVYECCLLFLHLKKMQENLEQRYALKFCIKLEKQQAYGDSLEYANILPLV